MKDLDWELFDKYLAGQATPADREEFERWLAERPERVEFVATWQRALAKMESGMAAADRDAVWAGALEGVGSAEPQRTDLKPPRSRPPRFALAKLRTARWRTGAIAAAALLVSGTALAVRALRQDQAPSTTATERVVAVPRGERARFRLPDGSEVLLAAGSTLRHPRAFPKRSREVTLEGEAYFTVEHEARRPFRVRAGNLIATDLGTEFLVRAYPEDRSARVVVRSGEVLVQSAAARTVAGKDQVIRPGELGRLGEDGLPRVEPADTAAYFGWTGGTLVFDGTPLRDALPQLSRWYDLEFRVTDSSLGSIPLSGRLDQTLTPTRLDLLASSLGLKQVRRGRVVTFSRP
jgi:ferric-dicitrate binding protein FerR (iron transport regulator)